MIVTSFEIIGLFDDQPPGVILTLESGERITVPLDGKPENEAILARVFGDGSTAVGTA